MKRRAALLLAVTAACGSGASTVTTTDQAAGGPPYRDLPDVPRRTAPVELPSQFEIPARPASSEHRRGSARSSRGAVPARGRASAGPGPGGDAPADVWHALAVCESGMRQNAVSADGLYLSFFQWALPTWRSVGGVGDPRTVGYDTQVELAKRLQARSGWGQWPRCSRKLGLA